MTKYYTISLSQNLVDLIDKIREKKGYSSRTDFVKQAVRNELRRINQ